MKLRSARQVIHDAYALHLMGNSTGLDPKAFWREGQAKKPNNNQQVCNAVEAGLVIATVESLAEPYCSWAKWAYGPQTEHTLPEQGRFFQWLEQDVNCRLDSMERDYRQATRHKIRDVVAYTVLDYRSYAVNERHLYPVSQIIKRGKIHRGNWQRDFQPWHEHYWTVCDRQLDRTVLIPVAKTLHRLRYGREPMVDDEPLLSNNC